MLVSGGIHLITSKDTIRGSLTSPAFFIVEFPGSFLALFLGKLVSFRSSSPTHRVS